ncbi:MAG TPA: helix-turn-helix domain-containing protein [Candidatus Bathyarchaeia archaeon]|nr:helix-turn-helix domain-containing protein [Candidatus Bathyarchaeia archaeon]
MKEEFNNTEKRILKVLYQHHKALSTSKVAKYTGYSYNTVKKYLISLHKRKYVRYMHHGNAIYWWLMEERG